MDVDEYDVDGGYFEDVSTLPSRGRLSLCLLLSLQEVQHQINLEDRHPRKE